MRLDCHLVAPLMVGVACAATGPAAQAGTSINYGPISHSGLKDEGAAAGGLKLALQFGLIVNQSGLQSTVKNASNPGSSSYGKYLSLSSLQKNFGASSSKSNAVRATAGIFPNQILTTYGVDQLQAQGLRGEGETIAIVGEGPVVTSDLDDFRDCFGFGGTSLTQSGSTSAEPILESALGAQVVSMVAPHLAHFYLYVKSIDESAEDGDLLGFLQMLAAPLQATKNGAALPNAPGAFFDVTEGNNQIFRGLNCCTAGPGFDLTSGSGSPLAPAILVRLKH